MNAWTLRAQRELQLVASCRRRRRAVGMNSLSKIGVELRLISRMVCSPPPDLGSSMHLMPPRGATLQIILLWPPRLVRLPATRASLQARSAHDAERTRRSLWVAWRRCRQGAKETGDRPWSPVMRFHCGRIRTQSAAQGDRRRRAGGADRASLGGASLGGASLYSGGVARLSPRASRSSASVAPVLYLWGSARRSKRHRSAFRPMLGAPGALRGAAFGGDCLATAPRGPHAAEPPRRGEFALDRPQAWP